MKNMNRKLLLYIIAAAILQPPASQAKQKISKQINTTSHPIESSYFLQTTIAENDCEKFLGQSCFFRDRMLSEPYLHKTNLTIFSDKIFATQFFNDKTIIAQVKDGAYSILSSNNNLISFNTKNGNISNLTLVKGNLAKEQNNVSKCLKAESLYNFYNAYNKDNEIVTKSGIYKDEYDFKGLNEYILFAEKSDPAEVMAITKNDEPKIVAIENLQLCKIANSDVLNVRYLNEDECSGDKKSTEECFKYQECEDVIAVTNCEVTLFKDGFN